MIRPIAIFFDGTYEDAKMFVGGKHVSSNPLKMKEAAITPMNSLDLQPKYIKGEGTYFGSELIEGAFGTNFSQRLTDAYEFLANRFMDTGISPENNEIYLFGFSRGAYLARLFAHLIWRCGVPSDTKFCATGIKNFQKRRVEDAEVLMKNGTFIPARVKMLGVFDTVKAAPFAGDYDDEILPDIVDNAFHAMSADENRGKFAVTKFKSPRAVQVWFPGVHTDIGGGYLETGLSDGAMSWMIDNAINCGLDFDDNKLSLHPDATMTPMHNEMSPFWAARINGGEVHRDVLDGNKFHKSVFERLAGIQEYKVAYTRSESEIKAYFGGLGGVPV